MKNLTKLALTGALIFGLNSCGDNEKYQNFARFMIKEGNLNSDGEGKLKFLKNNKEYNCSLYFELLEKNQNIIGISVYDGKSTEHFQDVNLNGLNYYSFIFNDKTLVDDFFFQSKENIDKYEMLIDSIPKWYAESKK